MLQTSGCSSGGTQEEGEVAQADQKFAEENGGDFQEDLPSDGTAPSEVASSGDAAAPADGAPADAPPADGGAVADNAAPAAGGDELSLDDPAPSQDVAAAGGDAKTAPAAGGDELSLDDPAPALPDDVAAGGAHAATGDAAAGAPAAGGAVATNEPPPTDDPVFNNDAKAGAAPDAGGAGASDIAAGGAAADPNAPPAGGEASSSSTDVAAGGATDVTPAAAPAFAPLVKIKDAAFTKKGALLNRVYLGRPGDTTKAVAGKIYNDAGRSKDLVAWNPFLKRGVKTGDKIYYSSPKDPADTKMLTFYEDAGIAPAVYTSKEGDNIRKVSKQLLGTGDSWKEVWATNASVESKGDIPAGLELKYWPDTGAPVQAMAGGPKAGAGAGNDLDAMGGIPNDPMSPPPMPPPQAASPPQIQPAQRPGGPPLPPGMNGGMPPTNVAGNDPLAPPPGQMPAPPPPGPGPASTPDTTGMGKTGAPPADPMAPPPPPPPVDASAPPPPPPVAAKPKVKSAAPVGEPEGASDPDTMMAVGFGGILLLAAAVLFVVIRKNRAKRMDLGQTQV